MKLSRFMNSFFNQLTLKRRIVFIFGAGTLIPFLCTAFISYNAMSSILTSKLDSGIRSNLVQVQQSLENTISNLNHISQQLAFPGNVANKLEEYLRSDHPFDRSQLYEEIKSELNVITFTNPSAGLTMYYFANDDTILFENSIVKNNFSLDQLPMLAEYFKIGYYGPHISNARYNDQFVLSALRKIDFPERDDVYVYIESGFKWTQNILAKEEQTGMRYSHLILDNSGRVAYSELDSQFPINSQFPIAQAQGLTDEFYWFKEVSNQGWSLVSLVPNNDYNKEKNTWMIQMIYLFVLFGVLSVLFAWMLWKMVYIPLNQFNHEIKSIGRMNFDSPAVRMRIPEFDYLLNQFQLMKEQITGLITEVEQKEKRRADLEVEKLLYQINPHFLMNTLDTAHWLAVINGQKELDHLILALNKLLYYNLGKLGQASTIFEEIDSLKQYLELQKIRYDFEFDVRIHVDDDIMSMPVPRFILQPLVENALYHGLNDDGFIQVEVIRVQDYIEIAVRDNGAGISEEDIKHLLDQTHVKQQKAGMGIGMNYVKRMVANQYEGRAKLEVTSEMKKGTTILLTLPIQLDNI